MAGGAGRGAIRERAGEILGADPEVQEWEIAGLHRDHRTSEGACTRVSWMDGDPGKAVITTTWDSRTALDQTRPMADQIRAKAAQDSGSHISEVAEFELAVAHLRVPELI